MSITTEIVWGFDIYKVNAATGNSEKGVEKITDITNMAKLVPVPRGEVMCSSLTVTESKNGMSLFAR